MLTWTPPPPGCHRVLRIEYSAGTKEAVLFLVFLPFVAEYRRTLKRRPLGY